MHTLYIAPSGAYGPSGQCRIYAAPGQGGSYDHQSKAWREVGLMDSAGNVRCIEPEFAALRDDAPLMAGTYYPLVAQLR
jgi:hypothetical protein